MRTLRKLLQWIGARRDALPRRTATRVYLSLHRGGLDDAPEGGHLLALGLHEALTRRGVACAIVDVDEWILRTALEEGRFRLVTEAEALATCAETGEPAWERERRGDIAWLLRSRSQLIDSALRSGGDAEVVLVLHSLDFVELTQLWGVKGTRDEVCLYYLGRNPPGREGYACVPMNPRHGGRAFAYGANAADDERTWERLAADLSRRLR